MAWKNLSVQLSNELKDRNDEIAFLRGQVADYEEKLVSNSTSLGTNTGHLQQVIDLQRDLDTIRREKDKLAQDAASCDKALQSTLAKVDSFERQAREANDTVQILQHKLAGKEEQIRRIQATPPSDQATSCREKDLQEQLTKLKGDMRSRNAENTQLKMTSERLSRQLQIEKAENANKIRFMRSDPDKGCDQDDEEVLPGENEALEEKSKTTFATPSAEPMAKFKPLEIPAFFESNLPCMNAIKQPDSPISKKALAPKKRKRTAQEEINDELTELGELPAFNLPTRLRQKKRTSSEHDPDAKTANNKKKDSAAPPSPPASQSAVEPFTFKAICTYTSTGAIDLFYHSKDLQDTVSDLWDRLAIITTSIWEAKAGEDWQWELLKPAQKSKTPVCVTKKCQKLRTRWHAGFEGVYACKDCAATGRPCFTYVSLERGEDGFDYGEFRLLPLLERDRVRGVKKDKEVRFWVNDCVKLVELDEMDGDEGWK